MSIKFRGNVCVLVCRGVLNIVHGTHDTVNRILDHKDIKAISFVGSDNAGRYIYERGSANGKRVQVCFIPSCTIHSRQALLTISILGQLGAS